MHNGLMKVAVCPLTTMVAMVLMGCPASAQPTVRVNPSPAQQSARQLIGINATGPQADLDRLKSLATASGFPSKQMDAPEGRELVIVFPPGSSSSAVAQFIEQLRGSQFSSLHFMSAFAPSAN